MEKARRLFHSAVFLMLKLILAGVVFIYKGLSVDTRNPFIRAGGQSQSCLTVYSKKKKKVFIITSTTKNDGGKIKM